MAKKNKNTEAEAEFEVEEVEEVEETRVAKAEAVAETVSKQVEEDARKAEEEAIQTGKDTELLEDQIWQEEQHDNPFEFVWQAQILEVRENKAGQKYVKFQAYQVERLDVKEPLGYVTEEEFRARFVKLVK